MGGAHVHGGTQFGLILLFVVLEIVVHIAIAIQSPRDAQAPIDEREDLIDLKATRTAFYVLFGGALLSIFTMHFRVTVWMHVAVRALLNRGCRAREVRQADRPLPARALTWAAARFETAFVTCASTTRR